MKARLALIALDAADLLQNEGAWTQGSRARDSAGGKSDPLSPEAVAWDVCGALIKAGDHDREAIIAVNRVFPNQPLAGWNDSFGRTQAEVVERLREAAVRIEASEG